MTLTKQRNAAKQVRRGRMFGALHCVFEEIWQCAQLLRFNVVLACRKSVMVIVLVGVCNVLDKITDQYDGISVWSMKRYQNALGHN